MRTRLFFDPHLVIHEIRLPKGGEWTPHFQGWCMSLMTSGICYWQEPGGAREMQAGSTLAISDAARGAVRASQLSEVAVRYFCVETAKLAGLLSLREQHFLKQAAEQKNLAARVFSPDNPVSEQFKELCSNPVVSSPLMRLRLLRLFMELFDWKPNQNSTATAPWVDGRERFRRLLNQMAASDLVELSVSDIAPMVSCSPRHLNRLFREEMGASFREKQVELRLARACELLSASDAKVIDVALESGYQSSSVFSGLFKKHFGVSPGQWRRLKSPVS